MRYDLPHVKVRYQNDKRFKNVGVTVENMGTLINSWLEDELLDQPLWYMV